jgi:hypothetical protein
VYRNSRAASGVGKASHIESAPGFQALEVGNKRHNPRRQLDACQHTNGRRNTLNPRFYFFRVLGKTIEEIGQLL